MLPSDYSPMAGLPPMDPPTYSPRPSMESAYSPAQRPGPDMVDLAPAAPWSCWTSEYQPPPPPAFASPVEAELALSGQSQCSVLSSTLTINELIFIGYKIEPPKLEFGDSKNGDYILKPDYHKLTQDYPPFPGVKTQNEFLLKPGSEYLGLANNLGKPGDIYGGHQEHEGGGYSEKYFHPKQF